MGFLSFFKQPRDDGPMAGDEVQQARTRARRRLVGAVLLLGVGLIGFPLLFETQPRPIAVDIPIHIPRKDAQPPLVLPTPKASVPAVSATPDSPPAVVAASAPPKVITETAAEAGRELPAPAPSVAASRPAVAAAEAARARALLEGATVKAAPTAAAPVEAKGRFVVQVGAYADAAGARAARARVEKLGLTTYTQVVGSGAGRRVRVRVGPFASREDAAKAADRIKSAGLPTALLTL